jgi:ABC-2 type transport system permease protein
MFLLRPIIRILAYVNKEVLEVGRQPALIAALVLGPFLILFIFGIGHRPDRPPLAGELVIPPGVELPRDPSYWRSRFGNSITIVGVASDEQTAVNALKANQVDLVVSIPPNAPLNFAQGKPSTIRVLHNRIDPVDQTYIEYVGYVLASELNRQVIAGAVSQFQQGLRQNGGPTGQLHQSLDQIQKSLQAGDVAGARQQVATARNLVATLQSQVRINAQFVGGVASAMSGNQAAAQQLAAINQTQDQLNRVASDLATLDADLARDPKAATADLAKLQGSVGTLDQTATTLETIPPDVIAAPFTDQTQNLSEVQPGFVAFYSPGVLALLLQHLAITISALSIVRERLLGTTELYQVAPTSTTGILLGKYLSYAILSLVVGGALTALLVQGLGVPLRGDPILFAEALALLVFASLGIGLTFSLLSTSQENAVQFSMLVLLASVFFSGFFLPLETLQAPATWISAALPVTYGIIALQDLMLRGGLSGLEPLYSLAIIGGIFFVLSAILMHSELRRR